MIHCRESGLCCILLKGFFFFFFLANSLITGISFGSCHSWFMFCWGGSILVFSLSLSMYLVLKDLVIMAKAYILSQVSTTCPRCSVRYLHCGQTRVSSRAMLTGVPAFSTQAHRNQIFARYFKSHPMHAQNTWGGCCPSLLCAAPCFPEPCTENSSHSNNPNSSLPLPLNSLLLYLGSTCLYCGRERADMSRAGVNVQLSFVSPYSRITVLFCLLYELENSFLICFDWFYNYV